MKATNEVGATEFKAKCLEFLDDIHSRKRVEDGGDPESFFGCLKGKVRINDNWDMTQPAPVSWEALDD
jgi:hypothetical protein